MPTLKRTIVLATSVCLGIALNAFAGPRTSGQRTSEAPNAPEGLEFSDPLIAESMALLRTGQADEAIKRLQQAAANAVGDPAVELRLGLGMVLLRAGQKPKALAVLKPLAESNDRGAALRAKVLLKVAGHVRSTMKNASAKSAPELASVSAWCQALAGVTNEIGKDMARAHQLLSNAISKGNGDEMVGHLATAHALFQEADMIQCADAAEGRYDIGRKHVEALAREIHQMNDLIDAQVRRAGELHALINDQTHGGNRLRRRGRSTADPDAITQYNQTCDSISRAWEAGKQVEAEFEDVQNQKGYHLTFNKRIFLRMPRDSLPKPFLRP